jgi:hypothetical protein
MMMMSEFQLLRYASCDSSFFRMSNCPSSQIPDLVPEFSHSTLLDGKNLVTSFPILNSNLLKKRKPRKSNPSSAVTILDLP